MPLNTVPEPSLLNVEVSPLNRWTLVQKMFQDFWNRWSHEYLHSLQTLPKWRQVQPLIKVGDLAILKDENLPPTKWALCRVINIHPGDDGLVRVVTVKTATSTLKRPIVKLCVLPKNDPESSTLVDD